MRICRLLRVKSLSRISLCSPTLSVSFVPNLLNSFTSARRYQNRRRSWLSLLRGIFWNNQSAQEEIPGAAARRPLSRFLVLRPPRDFISQNRSPLLPAFHLRKLAYVREQGVCIWQNEIRAHRRLIESRVRMTRASPPAARRRVKNLF